jgi:ABC-type sugar transport system permease subunit
MAKIVTRSRLKAYWPLYAFVLPSAGLIALFSYYPAMSAMYHAFFRWNASTISEFNGLQNFHQLLGWSPLLWIIMAAWIALMMMALTGRPAWARDRAPVALLALVVLTGAALWIGARRGDDVEALNLVATEAMTWFPRAFVLTALGVLTGMLFRNNRFAKFLSGLLILLGFLWFFYQAMMATGDKVLWQGFRVTFILVIANLFKMIPSIATAVVIHRLRSEKWKYWYRVLFVIPMIIPAMVYLLLWKFFYDPTQGILNQLLTSSGLMNGLGVLDNLFHWGVFQAGQVPSWLGDAKLVIPSLIFWGFPWVGVVGVLIYLAGLQSISEDVYEAADLDGVGPFQKFLWIELPLIMTQVRINLIMMILGTLKGYGDILVILGDSGGPQGVAMVPGLYMFRNAFVEGYAGKGCAVGLLLFVFILIMTEINNRYVRVDK